MRRLVLGLGLIALAAAAPARAAGPPMTFGEVMRDQRTLDGASFSPDGTRLLYGVRRNGVPSDGLAVPVTAHAAVLADLRTGRRRRLGGPETGGALPVPCSPWAPDGQAVALLTERNGLPRLETYDLAAHRLRIFQPVPTGTCPTWVGQSLLYPAATAEAPDTWSNRARAARARQRWTRAWRTQTPEVTVLSHDEAFPAPPAPEPGLALADPRTGRARLIARGTYASLAPAPDGRTFAAVRRAEDDAQALDPLSGRRGALEVFRQGPHGARRILTLAGLDVAEGGLAWSPDGRRLLFAARPRGAAAAGLFVLALGTRTPEPLPLPAGARLGPLQPGAVTRVLQLGWIGRDPAVVAGVPGRAAPAAGQTSDYGRSDGLVFGVYAVRDGRAVPLTGFAAQSVLRFAPSADGQALVAADGGLWRIEPGRPPRRITPSDLKVLALAEAAFNGGGPFRPAAASGHAGVILSAPDGQARRAVLDLATGKIRLSVPATAFQAWSPDLATLAARRGAGWSSRLETEGRRARAVAAFNPAWAQRPTGPVRPFAYAAAGRTLRGWIVLPPGPQAKPPPALVWIYGGQLLGDGPPGEAEPGGAATPVFDAQLWAAQGYAVLFPSTPLAPGATSDLAGQLTAETLAAVDTAAHQGWIDPDRLGLIGHSFGGFSVAEVLTRSRRFKAAIAMSGAYDWATAWGARAPTDTLAGTGDGSFAKETRLSVEEGQAGLGAPPWADPQAYVRASPLDHAADITTPLLITAGDLDLGPTQLAQAERLYAALRRVGTPAVLVRYWGEGHAQTDPGAVRDQWSRFRGWFAHYLRGDGDLRSDPALVGSARRPHRTGRGVKRSGTSGCRLGSSKGLPSPRTRGIGAGWRPAPGARPLPLEDRP